MSAAAGGLPGVVLAVLLPDLDVTCVDTVGKKAAFIRQAQVDGSGCETCTQSTVGSEMLRVAPFDVVSSARGLHSLADFTRLTHRHLARRAGIWMAMKRQTPGRRDRRATPADIDVFHVEPLTRPGAGGPSAASSGCAPDSAIRSAIRSSLFGCKRPTDCAHRPSSPGPTYRTIQPFATSTSFPSLRARSDHRWPRIFCIANQTRRGRQNDDDP